MEWKRPDSLESPIVWSRFEGKPHRDQSPLKYIVQDITEDLIEDAVEHMTRYFLVRENITSCIGYLEDKVSTDELRDVWRQALKQGVGLVALVQDPEDESRKKIAGVNMTLIVTLEDKEKSENKKSEFMEKIKGKLWKKTLRTLLELESNVDVGNLYGGQSTKYMSAYGLSVAPQYNGDGVGYQLLMARTPLCRALGVALTVTAFTGPASQYLAKKAGFETIASLDYSTYEHDGELAYPRLDGCCLLMAKRIPVRDD
ncbi:uncharacterized protein LOC111061942 [Nilaparvata lugens]|uniref:uncharacterized protein LOC111061942 n=1 Tax=Nilaparvata lugens TaxID=108931 RepID=UPI00193D365D|nr:uncharacterized protein LOC111061942 [Nilaparvata lugens]XP_039280211.1 uncharacterized protein LOC111061942 [Nilaparvata lugens]XP_039280212.1 uncharacterized protein LOC111061942 [Nilaparvata lugens]XP_039280213.1 uncharacterized protein LOC111061942 [Nilaparvata lugens]XP_039280214.1 uncharacterized protein LOC111061942 [Nilaparvata lugens]